MKKTIMFFVIAVSLFSVAALAVEAPAYKERQRVEQVKKKRHGRIIYDQNKKADHGCTYGIDKKTGKCYEPKEGQLYRDPKTGKTEMKETKKWNWPWKK